MIIDQAYLFGLVDDTRNLQWPIGCQIQCRVLEDQHFIDVIRQQDKVSFSFRVTGEAYQDLMLLEECCQKLHSTPIIAPREPEVTTMTEPVPIPEPVQEPRPRYIGCWTHRKHIAYGTLGFCAVTIAWLILFGADTALHEQVAIALITLAGGTMGSFVFGAVWDDHSIRNSR